MDASDLEINQLGEEAILELLESRLKADFTYDSGKIMGSMCTKPHPFAVKVYTRFIEKNLGDSGLFPATARLEKETIHKLGRLLSNPSASGQIVTGGTEANILAMFTAKKLSGKNRCEVVVPASAHCSFDKAADLLGIKIRKAALNNKHQVDMKNVRRLVNSNTVALVGIAGTTELGAVDPISELSELAVDRKLYLHVDAAFGGFVLPFLKNLGFFKQDFDFALPGVRSITVDPHKMGLAPVPSGGILFRDERLKDAATWNIPYLSGGESEQATIVGTRSGASVIAVWAIMQHLGTNGYMRIVERCMRLTHKLAEEIQRVRGMGIVIEPTMNIVGLRSDEFDIRKIALGLRHKGWAVSLFPKHIRIVIMPHVHEEYIEKFLEDLNAITRQLRG